MKADLRIDGGTLVLPGQGLIRAGLAVSGGKITAVAMEDALPSARRSIDASGLYVLPGLVDPHGHMGMNDDFPGECRAETRAAVQGGVTTIGLFIKSAGNHLKDAPGDLGCHPSRRVQQRLLQPERHDSERGGRDPAICEGAGRALVQVLHVGGAGGSHRERRPSLRRFSANRKAGQERAGLRSR